ncbi:MAG: tRNA preQ1(34) S-adenosylmethionine ribosyltransferase-isomerase QueA [Clostridiales bacterium]|nr:tRNA preQ1(34) S-adenosylmethionine ribosyltransferase-isomerase QueA [Clostridiales bacterium]
MQKELLKSTYYYDLPQEQIAQTPLEPRDSSRLLCFNRNSKKIEHKNFYDILNFLKKGDILVVNNSKVLPARLFGYKTTTGAKIEILLQKRKDLHNWEVIAKPTKRLSVGTEIVFNENIKCIVTEKGEYGACKVEFVYSDRKSFEEHLIEIGTMPLPPYIKEKLKNQDRYQTVYAKIDGSSAAPTAGLHFTKELIEKVKEKGVEIVEVLLHVGLGTFRPVKEDNILDHEMHSEYFEVTKEVADKINSAKAKGRRIVAVGTTSVRVLESATDETGKLVPQKRETKIFIYPPYKFKMVDALITNFHLPESTLIMLVSAFIGDIDQTLDLYKTAVSEKYRFFSFGDAMLIE